MKWSTGTSARSRSAASSAWARTCSVPERMTASTATTTRLVRRGPHLRGHPGLPSAWHSRCRQPAVRRRRRPGKRVRRACDSPAPTCLPPRTRPVRRPASRRPPQARRGQPDLHFGIAHRTGAAGSGTLRALRVPAGRRQAGRSSLIRRALLANLSGPSPGWSPPVPFGAPVRLSGRTQAIRLTTVHSVADMVLVGVPPRAHCPE
jgi:hypothetical protein